MWLSAQTADQEQLRVADDFAFLLERQVGDVVLFAVHLARQFGQAEPGELADLLEALQREVMGRQTCA